MQEISRPLTAWLMACLLSLNQAQSASLDNRAGNVLPETGVTFSTSDGKLQQLYDEAEKKAQWNIADFGQYKVLVEGAGYKNVWLETQPMGGWMYAKRNLEVARNNMLIFMDHQRHDGRLPGMIHYNPDQPSVYYSNLPGTTHLKNERLIAYYGWFQGYCFPMPAFELYFWLNRDKEYLKQLYATLEKFDEYLWKTRDSDHDGCLETWCVCDTGEDACTRFKGAHWAWPYDYPPSGEAIRNLSVKEQKAIGITEKNIGEAGQFPTPMESMDIMSYSYTGRDVLAMIAKELGNGREFYWRQKADAVRVKLKRYLWDAKRYACFDRDKDNRVMDILMHNNLRCMYFGIFDQQMADGFIRHHLLNPKEFWTTMPLPSIAANDPYFRNISGNNWSGQPEGLTFQRSIRALENYGHYAELTMIGRKLLKSVGDSLKFTQQFDPFTGAITPNLDGYGPTILATLEFISRMYGVHLTQDRVYWSCLNSADDYEYVQCWGNRVFKMKTKGNLVVCSINDRDIFSFTKGIRLISDLSGKMLEIVGIETGKQTTKITCGDKTTSLTVVPNAVYGFDGKFRKTKEVGFYNPDK